MKPHFIWKNQSSLEYGLTITKLPPRIKPEQRGEIIEVPGRNGTLFESEDAYKSKMIEIECTFIPPSSMSQEQIDVLLMKLPIWLDGFDKLILSDYPSYYYDASIINSIPIERLFKRYRKFIIEYEVQPFSKSIEEYTITKTTLTEEQIDINSFYPTSPILEIIGTGNITVNINNQAIHIKDLDGKIVIDCEFMNATISDGMINANNKVNGLPLVIDPGSNTIEIIIDNESTFESLTIRNRCLWI